MFVLGGWTLELGSCKGLLQVGSGPPGLQRVAEVVESVADLEVRNLNGIVILGRKGARGERALVKLSSC